MEKLRMLEMSQSPEQEVVTVSLHDDEELLALLLPFSQSWIEHTERDLRIENLMKMIRKVDALSRLIKFDGVVHTDGYTTKGGEDSGGLGGARHGSYQKHVIRVPLNISVPYSKSSKADFPISAEDLAVIKADHSKIPSVWLKIFKDALQENGLAELQVMEGEIGNPHSYDKAEVRVLKQKLLQKTRAVLASYRNGLPRIEDAMLLRQKDWLREEHEFKDLHTFFERNVFRKGRIAFTGPNQTKKLLTEGQPSWFNSEEHPELIEWFESIEQMNIKPTYTSGDENISSGYTPDNLLILRTIKERYEKLIEAKKRK